MCKTIIPQLNSLHFAKKKRERPGPDRSLAHGQSYILMKSPSFFFTYIFDSDVPVTFNLK